MRYHAQYLCLFLAAIFLTSQVFAVEAAAPQGWTTGGPRDEILPKFSYNPRGGPDGKGCFVIESGDVRAPQGHWSKTFAVEGGRHYRFSAVRKTTDLTAPRRSCVVQVTWQDDDGKLVRLADNKGEGDLARPVFPRDRQTRDDGWTQVTQVYTTPPNATQAKVELHLRWAADTKVQWAEVSLEQTNTPPGRKVRLAGVHLQPRGGKTPQGNRELFAPLIAEAAKQKADLVCLPESLTLYGNGHKYADVAEAVPGPSTKYFGRLAKQHNLYIVAGIMERVDRLVYNTAILMGPDGKLVGKYRKTCLPREEIQGGVAPGSKYPVFDTRFGKVGMMICWDVHFPEVARNLSNHGAEVIAMPIWGGNPALAKARAIENQIHLVSSTYTDPVRRPGWMKTAVWGPEGDVLVEADKWGTVVVTEVDLDAAPQWWYLGDFRSRIYRERPVSGFIE